MAACRAADLMSTGTAAPRPNRRTPMYLPASPAPDTTAAHTWAGLLMNLLQQTDLTRESAAWAMQQVVCGRVSPVQLTAFLTALRAKGDTAREIQGFVAAL